MVLGDGRFKAIIGSYRENGSLSAELLFCTTGNIRSAKLLLGYYVLLFWSLSFWLMPQSTTGDGSAMASRAGLPMQDLEFVQFHPAGA